MHRSPSIKSLLAITGGDRQLAAQVKALLVAPRSTLEQTPAGARRVAECYHPPKTHDVRLHALNEVLGTYGVEGFHTRRGWVDYLNAGDTYAPTIVRLPSGTYMVASWGAIAERE